MADVVPIKVTDEPVGDIQFDVIEQLESLLALAHAGQLQAIAYTGVYLGGDIDEDWVGNSSVFTLLAAIDLLHRSYQDAVIAHKGN